MPEPTSNEAAKGNKPDADAVLLRTVSKWLPGTHDALAAAHDEAELEETNRQES